MPTGHTEPAACAGSRLSRRDMLMGSVAAAAGAVVGQVTPARAAPSTKSGKAWASGVALITPTQLSEFGRFHGRPVDTVTVFMRRTTWADITTLGERSRWLSYTGADRPERLVQSFGWLPIVLLCHFLATDRRWR